MNAAIQGLDMKIGFIGLGNVGGKLSGSLIRNGLDVTVRDLDQALVAAAVAKGAKSAESPREMMERCDVVITCLPHPTISAAVVEGEGGLLEACGPGKIWLEMSTTDEAEIKRLGAKVIATGAAAVDCVLHTGELGTASMLKVMTNYLATANLLSVCEALTVSKAAGMDLATTYEAIKISSGTSFAHETESQVILNGSRCATACRSKFHRK